MSCDCSVCQYRRRIDTVTAKLDEPDAKLIRELYDRMATAETDRDWARAEEALLRPALESIRRWCQAYPVEIFAEPDVPAVHKAFKDAGLVVDQWSAYIARKLIYGFKKECNQVLGGEA